MQSIYVIQITIFVLWYTSVPINLAVSWGPQMSSAAGPVFTGSLINIQQASAPAFSRASLCSCPPRC